MTVRAWPAHTRGASWLEIPILAGALGLAACDGSNDSGPVERGNVAIADEHNYTSESRFAIPSVGTVAGSDVEICWTDVTDDLQCHGLDPLAEIDNVSLLRFQGSSEDAIAAKLNSGPLGVRDVDNYVDFQTDHVSTCTKLSSFAQFETPIDLDRDYPESSDFTYMLVFTRGTVPGVGVRTMLFVRPSSASVATRVSALPGCGILEFAAHLADAAPLPIPTDPPWVVDWNDVTRDAQGNPIDFDSIDALLLGFYPGMTVGEIEASIFDIEQLADPLYELELTGKRNAELSDLRARADGAPFTGFDRGEDGVWMLALLCETCQNPQPVVLTVLAPGAD